MLPVVTASLFNAAAAYQVQYLEAKAETDRLAREREAEAWEDEHPLPLMTAEQRSRFLAERVRLKERREDIKRQERMHRERLAVESRKASALERNASRSNYSGLGLGIILGSVLDGD